MTASTPPLVLLQRASQILDDEIDTGIHSARMAALLARQALERLVDARCTALGQHVWPRATMRSKLSILTVHDEPERSRAAKYAWGQLSAACHHHAYELPPTVSEVRALCAYVMELFG